jgi:hypothetical protein
MASLRENMGYQTTMFPGRKEAIMIFSPEQALLKAQVDLQDLVTFARQAARLCLALVKGILTGVFGRLDIAARH